MNAILKPKITFARESLTACRHAGIEPLLHEHWLEISTNLDIPLNVDWEGYQTAEDAGLLRMFTARFDSALVGYAAYIVRHNMHYKDSLQAVQDVLFLAKDYRRGRIGYELIAFADEELRAEGCQVVFQHVKFAHPTLGELLKRQGYKPVEMIWSKRLDKI